MKTSNIITLFAALAATLLLDSCTDGKGAGNMIPKESQPVPVKVVKLEKSTTAFAVNASGQLTTDDESVLGFKTGGVVSAVLVKEGDPVKKGQLLATLDLTEINALVAQARSGFEKAQRDHHRVENLYRDSVATLEQFENSETALDVAKQQLEAAAFNKTFSEIHAPANGYVLRKFVNDGQVVSIGDPIVLTNAVTNGKWILKVSVSDRQWTAIKIHDKATVSIDAFPAEVFDAEVIRKSETSDPSTGAFSVELQLKKDNVKLATGMFGTAKLQSGRNVSSWNVPYEAVLDANGNEGFVFVTDNNKTARKQRVEIESFNGKYHTH